MKLKMIGEPARCLGHKSRSQLCRLINDGYLHQNIHVRQNMGQRFVGIDGLKQNLQYICQLRPKACSSGTTPLSLGDDAEGGL